MTDLSPGLAVRRLVRAADRAALATALPAGEGPAWPYASLVLCACDLDATPLLLLSGLAEHSRNIAADPRAGLLVTAEPEGDEDPLAQPRATLLGRAEAAAEPRLRERFLRRHPAAALYAGFADFRLYRLRPERAHLVAGFGRIRWATAGEMLQAGVAALAAAEAAILEEMNRNHAGTLDLMANRLAGRPGGDWRLTGLDPEGCDLIRGASRLRLAFAAPVATPAEAREALAALARAADAAAG